MIIRKHMSRRFVLRMLMPIAVVCVFAVSAQPAQAGFGSFLKKLFFGGSERSTEQSVDSAAQAQPRAATGNGTAQSSGSAYFRITTPDGKTYESGATIEGATPGQAYTVAWSQPDMQTCRVRLAGAWQDSLPATKELSYTVPQSNDDVKLTCQYQEPATDSDDGVYRDMSASIAVRLTTDALVESGKSAAVTSRFYLEPTEIIDGQGRVRFEAKINKQYGKWSRHGTNHKCRMKLIGGSAGEKDVTRDTTGLDVDFFLYPDDFSGPGTYVFRIDCDGTHEDRTITVKPFDATSSSLFSVNKTTVPTNSQVNLVTAQWDVPGAQSCELSVDGGKFYDDNSVQKTVSGSGTVDIAIAGTSDRDAIVRIVCSTDSVTQYTPKKKIILDQSITITHAAAAAGSGNTGASDANADANSAGSAASGGESNASDTQNTSDAGSAKPQEGTDFEFDVMKGASVGDGRVNVTVRLEVKTAGVSCSVSSTDNSVSVQGIGKGNSLSVTEPATLPVTYTALCANSGKTTVVKETVKKEDTASGNSGSSEGSGASSTTSDDNGGNSANLPVEGTDFEFEVWKYEEQDLVGTSIKILKDDIECSVSGAGIRRNVVANKDRKFNGSGALRVDFPATYTATCKRGNATTVITKTIKADGKVEVVADSGANSSSGGSGNGTSNSSSNNTTAGGDANDSNSVAGSGTTTVGATTLTVTPTTVKPGEPFTLTWSSDKTYCEPSNGPWSVSDVMKQHPDTVQRLWVALAPRTKLKVKGTFTVKGGVANKTAFAVTCADVAFTWPIGKQEATVYVDVARADNTGTNGTTTSDTNSTNSGSTASAGTLIAAFDVTPKNIPRDGEVTVYFKTTDVQQKCELSGVQGDVVQILNNAVSQESQAFTRPVALGARFDDGVVRVMLTCTSIADASVTEQRVQDVRVGAHAGIRYFTADTYHLDAPGDVWLSWDTFGMKSCSVKRDVLDNGNMFDLMRRSWSSSDGSYRVSKTTQFTLTCQPKDKNEAVQKRTLVVSVGDYTAEKPIEGTEDAEYVRYCPFKIDNTIDHLVNFSQRLEWAGQKEIVNGANVPAGVYKVWLSASDSLAGRSYQDQPNERYYVEFYDADGKVLAQTGPTNDLSNDTATGAVTLVTDKFILPRMAASVAAVHADGESASLNPGCMLLKRVGDVATDDDANQVVCTADVKLCPDGSYVGRVAPSCNFAACPGDTGASGDDNAGTTNSQTTSAGNQRLQPVTRSATRALQPSCKSNWSSNVSGNFARPDGLVDVTCAGDDVVVHVGKEGDNNYYTWGEAYYTTDGDNLSNKTTVNGQRDATGKWVVGKGEVVIPQAPRSVNYVATYTCVRSDGAWQCGCADGTQNCSQPEQGKFIWYLTGYNR